MDLDLDEISGLFPNASYTSEEIFLVLRAHEKSQKNKRGAAKIIFEDWKEVHEAPRARFDDKRRKLINSALELGYTVDDLKLVSRGVCFSPYHMGTDPNNKSKTLYNYPELLFRNADKIDKFLEIARRHNITPDAKIRRSDHDGSKNNRLAEYTEFSPKGRL